MRLLGTSFRIRLIVSALIWIAIIVVAIWFALNQIVRTYVGNEFLDELDHHSTELVNLAELDANGQLTIRVPLSDHRFTKPASGFYWQLERATGETLRSPSLVDARLSLTLDFSRLADETKGYAIGPTGETLTLERIVIFGSRQEALRVAVATDTRLIDELIEKFRRTLAIALAATALGLIGAAMAQIAYGLRPVGRIRAAVQAVRLGKTPRLPADLPDEVAPLAANVNALLDANEEMIRRARIQAGNLAHALKTPLALLYDEGHRLEAAGHGGHAIIEQCERMRRQIDYQLAKARAAVSRNGHIGSTRIGPIIRAIVSAMERLYRNRNLTFDIIEADPEATVDCESQDLDEIFGNLLDNAAKWSHTKIKVVVTAPSNGVVRITVEDDGPGMPVEARDLAFEAGRRLDEMVPGSGLGLAIVRGIAEAYGGRAWIDGSDLGGAAAHVELPSRVLANG